MAKVFELLKDLSVEARREIARIQAIDSGVRNTNDTNYMTAIAPYLDGSGAIVSQAIEATGFVDATADTITNALPKIDAIVAKSGSENKALVLHNTGDGEYGGGNAANAIRVKVAYRVHATGF